MSLECRVVSGEYSGILKKTGEVKGPIVGCSKRKHVKLLPSPQIKMKINFPFNLFLYKFDIINNDYIRNLNIFKINMPALSIARANSLSLHSYINKGGKKDEEETKDKQNKHKVKCCKLFKL